MDQYVDSRQKEILWELLANPANNGLSYIQSLKRLVQDNPQSGLLQVLLARAGDKKQVGKATVYYNPRILYKLINHPEALAVVDDASIIRSSADIYTNAKSYFNMRGSQSKIIDADAFDNNGYDAPVQQDSIIADEPVQIIEEQQEEPEQVIELPETIEENTPVNTYENPQSENIAEAESTLEDGPFEEIAEAPVINSEYNHTYHAFENSGPEQVAQPVNETPVEEAYQYNEPEATVEASTAEEPEPFNKEQPVQETPPPIPPYEAPRFNARFPKPGTEKKETPEPVKWPQDIDDDVYDEIVSIEDIGFEAIAKQAHATLAEPFAEARFSEPHIDSSPEEEEASEVLFHQPQPVVEPISDFNKNIQDQEDRLILGGIVNTDYLSFDKKLDELRGVTNNTAPVENAAVTQNVPVEPQPVAQLAEHAEQQVSRYDDDNMPYTFMWWLNKTRKEHAGTFQPYVNEGAQPADAKSAAQGAAKHSGGNELQQQYYENIFSLTSVSSVERDTGPAKVEFDPGKKEDVIIERFIHTEPQIKPLSADRLDNENKAKKSSEDLNDFVTETLARIYCDQMLYHKAIATYKKLILKFPEKKLYFAAQIEQLEKKTN